MKLKKWFVTRYMGREENVLASKLSITHCGALEFATDIWENGVKKRTTLHYIAPGQWTEIVEVED